MIVTTERVISKRLAADNGQRSTDYGLRFMKTAQKAMADSDIKNGENGRNENWIHWAQAPVQKFKLVGTINV